MPGSPMTLIRFRQVELLAYLHSCKWWKCSDQCFRLHSGVVIVGSG